MNKIKEYRKKAGLTQTKLGNILNVGRSAIAMYENGTNEPDIYKLKIMAELFNTTIDNLVGNANEPLYNSNRIKVLGHIPAGIPVEMVEDEVDWEDIPEEWLNGEKYYFGLKVRGNSMHPKYLTGDTVIILKQDDCENGQDAIVTVNGEDATLKKVIKNDNSLILQPYNSAEYSPAIYTSEQIKELPIKILGVVKEIRRKI